ncbi:MAG: ABC-F family ATP-binding cassette domain-containing protein [Akkermansiaceae bacterium]|nr:ABC-F family ATP-binding cassette domain-containing protein [Akkermansiaceae bacterium]
MLAISNLRVEFGARVLFDGLSFSVGERDRISFAGPNGAGKSTLMKCLAGVLEPNAGTISKPKDARVGYLPQEGIHLSGHSLYDEAESSFAEARGLQRRIDELSAELRALDPRSAPYSDLLERIGTLELQLEHFDPARIKPRIESVLQGLGFSRGDFRRDCGEFSGGWQMRIAMSKLFLQEPEVLLLDEPTNHLDVDAQRWMEQFLHGYRGAIILISHDKALLDTLTNRTIAFENGKATEYAGNYSFFVEESRKRREILEKQYKAQQRDIQKAEAWINRFRAKNTKATQVQSRIKQLAKMERIELDLEEAGMNFTFPPPPPSAHSVAVLEKASMRYGALTVFENFDFEITRGEKFAVVGPNGAGKSTFCRLITGEEAPTEGSVEFGSKVFPSFFSQNHADELDPARNVLETVEAVASRDNIGHVRNLLGCFLFRGDDVFKPVGVLSGGERSRVALVRMLVRPANFLILDEPTNHLDMQSQEVLQNALHHYTGTVIIVSHNRAFLDPLVTRTLEFRQGQAPRIFFGNLTYYLEKKEEEESGRAAGGGGKEAVHDLAPETPANRKEQRRQEAELRKKRARVLKPLEDELAVLEEKIAELEAAKATLTEHLGKPEVTGDPEELRKATTAFQSLSEQLETAFTEWTSLSDQVEKVRAEVG